MFAIVRQLSAVVPGCKPMVISLTKKLSRITLHFIRACMIDNVAAAERSLTWRKPPCGAFRRNSKASGGAASYCGYYPPFTYHAKQ